MSTICITTCASHDTDSGGGHICRFTGAGPMAMQAMQRRQPIPQPVRDAINAVCEAAAARGVRVWIDAEQQAIQATIDDWTMDLMRRHNRNPDRVPLVYTTIQAYLRGSRASTTRHVELAAAEGWSLGVKLVRGAYIAHETRSLVHDTKDETDRAYDDIASALIERRRPGDPDARAEHGHPLGSIKYPQTALFLATHNADSVRAAVQRYRGRVEAGEPTCLVEVGQLQGMADEVGYELVQAASPGAGARSVPAAYKSLVWGSVGECLGFLYRRAVENQGAATRTRHMARALRAELRRRILCPCRGSGTCI